MSVQPVPPHEPDNGDSDGPTGADLYQVAVEEYRFQAQFNWTRVQYLLAFNAAILTAASLLAGVNNYAILVYLLGIVAAAMTAAVHRVQHAYYQRARDRLSRIEALYVPPEARTDTTPTLANKPRHINVTGVVYLLLAAIGMADLAGIIWILAA